MNIDNIRVKVSKRYHGIYRDLTQDTAVHEKVFPRHGDLFTLCMLVGYRAGTPSEDFKGADLFWSHSLNKHQQTVLKAVAIAAQGGNYQILNDPEGMVHIAEKYADRGMEILLNSVLNRYVKEEDMEYTLRFTTADELEKDILVFVLDELQKGPFLS